MDSRRQRIAWVVALALVTALISAPSLLTALATVSPEDGASAIPGTDVLTGDDLAGLVRAVPDVVRGALSGWVQDAAAGIR
jgi:hypothetical protein